MSEIENNGLVGHPITNMLMREACAADLGAADHADAGGPELTGVASLVLNSGGLLTMDARGANIERAPAAAAVEGVDHADPVDELPPALAEALKDAEELFEAGRALVVQTLDKFDTFGEGIGAILAHIVRLEAKVDRVLTHFGEVA